MIFLLGDILDFGLINENSLLLIFKRQDELIYEEYNIENHAIVADGLVAPEINFYEYDQLFLKNIEYHNQNYNPPFTLALVLKVLIKLYKFIIYLIYRELRWRNQLMMNSKI